MPYRIEWSNENSVVSFSGNVSFQELREVGNAHYGDERFDAIKFIIIDFSDADLSQISTSHTNIVASVDSVSMEYKPELKMALVVKNDRQRELCESYIASSIGFQSSWSHAIFTNPEEAGKWCSP